MIAPLSELLHRLRDGLLVAATALERGEEVEAAEQIEETLRETRERLADLRAA